MTLLLLRLHPATGNPARWMALSTAVLLLATLATGALVAARGEEARDFIRVAAWPIAVLLSWAAIAVQLLLPAGRSRAGVFVMTLPLSGRRLWVTSLAASISIVILTALVMTGILQIVDLLLGLRLGERLFGTDLLLFGLCQIIPAGALCSVLLHLPQPGEERLLLRGWLGLYAAGAAVLPGASLILFRRWPLVFAGGCLIVAAGLVFWRLRRQPEALLLETSGPATAGSAAARIPSWPWLTAVRWGVGLPTMAWALVMVTAFGVLQAVLSRRYSEEDETGLFMAPMLVYILVTWLPAAGRFLHRLGPLPLSNRKITAMLTLPVLAAALLGYAAGLAFISSRPHELQVEFQSQPGLVFPMQPSDRALLRLPPHRFEIAWDGQAPLLRAPWGESHKPWQARIMKGAAAVLHSPVSTAEATTPEFAAWQISNALEIVYGVRIAHERIRATHIGLDGDGRPVLVKGLQDLLPAGAQPLSPLTWAVPPLTVAICGASFLLLAGLLFGLRREDAPRWKRSFAAGLVLAGLMIAYIIRVPLSFSGVTRGWILGGALSSLTRSVAAATPGGAFTFWLLAAAALWLAFLFAAMRLARAEILPGPPRRFGF